MTRTSSSHFVIGLFLIAATCCGCGGVNGSHSDAMRYEPKDDSFEFVHSWTNINCPTKRDLVHVKSLWKRRDSIMVIPFQILWGAPAVERLGSHKFLWIDLTHESPDFGDPIPKANFDLKTIQVIPGQFYLNRHDNLCHFQQAVVPGETMDALLKDVTVGIAVEVARLANNELEEEKKKNQRLRRPSWNAWRTDLLSELAKNSGVRMDIKPTATGSSRSPLERTSLDCLINSAKENTIKISRTRDEFTFVIPLSRADSLESITTFNAFRDAVLKYVKEGQSVPPGIPEIVDAVSVTDEGDAGLQVLVNFTKLAKAQIAAKGLGSNDVPEAGQEAGYQSTVKSIQESGIPVSDSFSLDDLLAKYLQRDRE